MSASTHTADSGYGWQLPAVSPNLVLAGGVLRFDEAPKRVTEVVEPGFKLVLVLGGQIHYQLRERQAIRVQGPALHLSLNTEPFTVRHEFDPAAALEYVAVRMPAESLALEFGIDVEWLARRASGQRSVVLDQRADRSLQGLGRQMLLCPMQGPMRQVYLAGKALEMAATVMSDLDRPGSGYGASPLRTQDVRRLRSAQDILRQRVSDPPSLPELARLVGTNVNKLTTGFRQLFGCSVYGFVREQRLELAYRLIATGHSSVAEAARACGYADSHFTKVFRRRFGIAPSALR
jgi:AraC family transcriptional activator of pyochelin receptor